MSSKSFDEEVKRAVGATALLMDMSTVPYVRLPFNDFRALYQGAKVYSAGDEMYQAALGMKKIVEEITGAMNHGTWRDENGVRLKDTPEWVALYLAISKAEGRKQ